jgi:anti-anti-sigma factor
VPDTEYICTTVNGIPVVVAATEIDITTAEQLYPVLLETVSAPHQIVVLDMSQTRFCDSSGLHVLIRAHHEAAADGRELRLIVSPDGAFLRIITLTGVDALLHCFANRDEALTSPYEGEPVA